MSMEHRRPPLASSFAIVLLAGTAHAQSAEPSVHDADIAACAATDPSAKLTITQQSAVEAIVHFSGASAPTMLWVTDEAGTVIAFENRANRLTQNGVVLSWAPGWPRSSAVSRPPTQLQARSCPPAANLTAPVVAWRGLYDSALAVCCSEFEPSVADQTAFGPTITVNWNTLTFDAAAPTAASHLNYAKDSTGMVLHVRPGVASGAYSLTGVPFNPLATTIEVCALLDPEARINPICRIETLVDRIASDIEQGQTKPAGASLEAIGVSTRYAGPSTAQQAILELTQPQGWCVMYARNASAAGAGPVAALSNSSSLVVELSKVTASITLYACCGISIASNGRPIRCPANALNTTVVEIAGQRTAANAAFLSAQANSNGVLAASPTADLAFCTGGVYRPGDWAIDATGLNCTCMAPPDAYTAPEWACAAAPAHYTFIQGSQMVAIVSVAIVMGVIALLWCAYMMMSRRGQRGGHVVKEVEIAGGA